MSAQSSVRLHVSNGLHILLDAEDVAMFSQYKWRVSKSGYIRRARRKNDTAEGDSSEILIHRELLKAQKGEYVDHINGDTFDNRKANLRIVTASQNLLNRRVNKNKTSSKYKGVSKDPKSGNWMLSIRLVYTNETEAAKDYNRVMQMLHGDFVKLNIIQEDGL